MLIFGNGSPLLQTRNTVPSQTMTQLSASSLPRRSRTAASSFDALCKEMKENNGGDDMSGDLHPHGARETVLPALTADNNPGR